MPRTASPEKPEGQAMDTSVMKFNLVSTTGPRKSQNQVDVSIKGYGITPSDKESPDMEKMIRKLTKNVIKIQKQIQKENSVHSEKGNPDVDGNSKTKRNKKRKPSCNDTIEDIPKIQVVQQMEHSNPSIFAAASKSSHIIEHSSSCSNNKLNALNKSTPRSGSSHRCTCLNNDEATNEACSCEKLSEIDFLSGKVSSCGCNSMAKLRSNSHNSTGKIPHKSVSPSSSVKSKKSTSPSVKSTKKRSGSHGSSRSNERKSRSETSNTSIMSTKDAMTSITNFVQTFPIEHDTSEPISVSQAPSSSSQKKRKSTKTKSSSIEFDPTPSPQVSSFEKNNSDGLQSVKSKKRSKDKLHSPHSSTKSSTKSKHKTCPKSCKSASKISTAISRRKVSEEKILKSSAYNCGKDPTVSHSSKKSCGKVSACGKDLGVSHSSKQSCGKTSAAEHRSNSKCGKSSSGRGSHYSTSTRGKTSSNESMTELDRKTRFLEQFLLCGRSEQDGSGSTSTVSNVKSDGKSKYLDQYFNCNCDDTTKLDRKSKMVEDFLTCECKSEVQNTFSETKNTYLKGYLGCDCAHGLGPTEIQKKMKFIENSLQCNRVESTFLMDDIDKKNTYLNQFLKCDCANEHEINHKGKFIERILTCECNHEHDPDIDSKRKFLNKHVKCECGSSCPKQAEIKEPTPKPSKIDVPVPVPTKTLTPKTSEKNVSKTHSKSKSKKEVPEPVPLGQPRICGDKLQSGKARLKMPLTKPGWADGKVLLCSCGEGEVSECRCQDMCGSLTSIKRSPSNKRKNSAPKAARKRDSKTVQKVYSAHKSVEKVDPFQSSQIGDGLVCGCGKSDNAQCICDSLLYSTGSGTKTVPSPAPSKTKTRDSEPTITIAVKKKTENGDVHLKLIGHGNDQQNFNGRLELTERTGGPLGQVHPPLSPVSLSSVSLSPVSSGPRLNLKNITFVTCPNVEASISQSIEPIKIVKSTELAYRSSHKRASSNPLATLPTATHMDTSLPCHRPKSGAVSSSSREDGSTSTSCPHLALSVSNSDDYECYVCASNKDRTSNIENPTVMVVETMEEKKTPFRSSEKKKMKSSLMPSIFLKYFKSKKPKIEEKKMSKVTFQKSETSCKSLYRHGSRHKSS